MPRVLKYSPQFQDGLSFLFSHGPFRVSMENQKCLLKPLLLESEFQTLFVQQLLQLLFGFQLLLSPGFFLTVTLHRCNFRIQQAFEKNLQADLGTQISPFQNFPPNFKLFQKHKMTPQPIKTVTCSLNSISKHTADVASCSHGETQLMCISSSI